MDLRNYLERIDYHGSLAPSFNTLKELQKTHLLNIPFENLDIHINQPIKLNVESFFEKIVINSRGGFCYELNGLFYQLLVSLGYKVKMVSARVHNGEGNYSQEYDHMTLIVTINGKDYLSDVGFGDFLIGPLEIDSNDIQQDESGDYRIDKIDEDTYRISKFENQQNSPEFIFKNKNAALADFAEMCHYHQTSSQSHFTQRKLISLPTENGRITLTSDKLKITENGKIKKIQIKSDDEFEGYLLEYFQIRL